MAKRTKNGSLHQAKQQRYDEFYTQRADIDRELAHYQEHFWGKTILCNCDDPRVSNFFKYFASNFEVLGLERLIATCYKSQNKDLFSLHDSEQAVYIDYRGEDWGNNDWLNGEIPVKPLKGDGSFDSEECIELLEEADIVVTNPPFSLFREYIATLIKYEKKFLVIGPFNAITYKEIFPLIASNQMWLGYGFLKGNAFFKTTQDKSEFAQGVYNEETGLVKFRNVHWFTNLEHKKRNEELILVKKYKPEDYPKYDNYDAINVDRVENIPCDYEGVMGVPITFLDKYNPEQFEIVAFRKGDDGRDLVYSLSPQPTGNAHFVEREYNPTSEFSFAGLRHPAANGDRPYINGVRKYARLLIRHLNTWSDKKC